MKKYNKSRIAGYLLLFSIILLANSSNPPNGRTGAPGDSTCNSCHSGNNSALDGEVSFDGLPSTIDANTTYTITVTVDNPNGNGVKGGFQWVALDGSNNDAGSMNNPGNDSGIALAGGRTYHEHQPAQPFNSSNEISYTVDWTAPSGPDGETITFWAAGLISNGSGNNSGDRTTFTNISSTLVASASPLTATITAQTNVTCNNGDDGSATVTAMGGAPGYMYQWDDSQNQTTQTASNLEAGTYNVTVTDDNTDEVVVMVTITEPTALNITVIANNPEICGNSNGYLEVGTSGGNGPYSYNWSNGGTGNFQTDLLSNTYSITVTDDNNCQTVESFFVDSDFGAVQINLNAIIHPSCLGDSNGYLEVGGMDGISPYSYIWSNNVTGAINNNLVAGTYAVTVTDANNCMAINVFMLNDPPGMMAVMDSTDVVCAGDADGMASVTVSGGSGAYTYSWSDGTDTPTNTGLSGGTYYVTIMDGSGCSIEDSTMVNEPPAFNANLTWTDEIMSMMNGSASANPSGGTPGYTVNWSNGMNGLMISNLSAGTYVATVTDTIGCTVIDSVIVANSNCALSVTIDVQQIECFGFSNGAIDLTTANAVGTPLYTWSDGDTSEDRSNLAPGFYSVTIVDDLSCQVQFDSIEIIEAEEFTLSPDIIVIPGCQGQTSGTISAIPNGGVAPYSYAWGNGLTTDTIMVLSGFYPVTVTDANNCTAVTLVNLTGNDVNPPNIVATDFTLYLDETGFTSVIVDSLFDLGSIDDCDLLGFSYDTTALDCAALGVSLLPIELEDINGNIAYDTLNVTVIDTFPPEIFCIDDMTITECDGWSFNQPLTFDNCGATLMQTSGPQSGDLLVLGANEFNFEAVDSSGNTAICSFIVTVENGLMADVQTTDVTCFGFADGTVNLQVSGGTAPYNFSIDGVMDMNQLEEGTYYYLVTDDSGCELQDSFLINEPPVLFISDAIIVNSTTSNSMDGSIDIIPQGGTGSYSFEWYLEGVLVSNDEDPAGLAPGVYTCIVTDENDCVYTSLDYIVEATTSSNEIAILNDLKVYPNPASEQLNILLSSEEFRINKVNVISIDGKVVISKTVNNNTNSINVSSVQSGVYMLQMILEDDIVYKKVIID